MTISPRFLGRAGGKARGIRQGKGACASVAFASVVFVGSAHAAERLVPGQYASIQSAINAAANGDVVVVAAGTYNESLDLLGKQITVRGNGAASTTLNGSTFSLPILTAFSGENGAVVEKFTFTGGRGGALPNCSAPGAPVGGAVYVDNSSLIIRDCVFYQNGHSSFIIHGGAIYIHENARLQLERCDFVENGFASFGGAIGSCDFTFECENGCAVTHNTVTISDCMFTGNNATHGGALFLSGTETTISGSTFTNNTVTSGGGAIRGDTVSITDCLFTNNKAAGGGAVFSNVGTLADCTFTGNEASTGAGFSGSIGQMLNCEFIDNIGDGSGGGAKVEGPGLIDGCTFTGNTASFGGGLRVNLSEGTVSINDCTFTDNDAGFGGGLYGSVNSSLTSSGTPEIRVLNSSFLRNNAGPSCCNTGNNIGCFTDGLTTGTYYGGGADLRETGGGKITVANSLFAVNTGTHAGGLHVLACTQTGSPSGVIDIANVTSIGNSPDGIHARIGSRGIINIANSIVRGNTATQIASLLQTPVAGEASLTVSYSNVQGGYAGTGNINANPLFVNPSNDDYRLGAGSPSVDAGRNASVPSGVLTDLAGENRFVNDPATADTGSGSAPLVDMGAYEFQGGAPACAADFNGVNGVTVQDIFDFLTAWLAGNPSANFNQVNGVTVQDIFDFLTAWLAGC